MKFSDIKSDQWESLQPYLDTCLLPLTGLGGSETPWQMTDALERLRDMMERLEVPFKGRIVTWPAIHYVSHEDIFPETVNRICKAVKSSGFKYVILISPSPDWDIQLFSEADLVITPDNQSNAAEHVKSLWNL